MPDDPYSLVELARLADVTPRTIRYYVAQGLLPSPGTTGPATRYTEGHLARLRLIRRLQRDHLPLAEIRVRLERMGDEEVQAALDAADRPSPQPPVGTAATLAFVRDLMTRAGVAPRFYDEPAGATGASADAGAPSDAAFQPRTPDSFPVRETPDVNPTTPRRAPWDVPVPPVVPAPSMPPGSAPVRRRVEPPSSDRTVPIDRSTWERHAISPDVEIHVRRPQDRLGNKRVERLIRIARELFEDDA